MRLPAALSAQLDSCGAALGVMDDDELGRAPAALGRPEGHGDLARGARPEPRRGRAVGRPSDAEDTGVSAVDEDVLDRERCVARVRHGDRPRARLADENGAEIEPLGVEDDGGRADARAVEVDAQR